MTMNMDQSMRGGTMCLSHSGLEIGASGTNDVNIDSDNGVGISFMINGYTYHKADTENIPITAATAQAVSTSCLYLIQINSSGTVSSVKGTEVLTADVTAGNKVLEWPALTADNCPIGAVRVDTDASTTFTALTTNFDAAGITDTFYSLSTVPTEPISS